MAGVTAAKATRKYFVDSDQSGGDDWYVFTEEGAFEMHFSSIAEAEAACNRLNAVAFLEAIRDPSDRMRKAGARVIFGGRSGA